MSLGEYIKSERFIHDSLVETAKKMVAVVRTGWNKRGKVEAFIVAWPKETVTSDTGHPIDGPCLAVLETIAGEEREAAIGLFAERTNAYALLLVEQRAQKEVMAVFESPHGTCSWSIPLARHGDRWVAGEPEEKSGGGSIGVLKRL